MKTTANQPTDSRAGAASGLGENSVLFAATCPKCRQQVLQRGYSRILLYSFLDIDYPIEACCAPCGEVWPISTEERRAIVGALSPKRT